MISRRLLRIKAMQTYYSAMQSEDMSLEKAIKEFEKSVQESYRLYLSLFCLLVKIKNYAEKKIEIRQHKLIPRDEDLNPNKKFIENKIFLKIINNKKIEKVYNNSDYNWDNHPELISDLWKQIESSSYYLNYMVSDDYSLEDDKKIVKDIIINNIVENEQFDQILEDLNIYWNDDLEFLLSIIIKNIYSAEDNDACILISDLYKTEEDKSFGIDLIKKTILKSEDFDNIIVEFLEKWDLQRIAFLDKIILHLALCELLEMPTIPVKVAINEYLDIAKYYSTTKSNNFINGILDAVYNQHKEAGTLNKKGKGMLG